MPYVFNVFTSKLDLVNSPATVPFITAITTTGTTGASTVISGVLNVPQYSAATGGVTKGFVIAMAVALG